MKRKAGDKSNLLSYIAAVVLFLAMLAILLVATARVSQGTEQQGRDTTYEAIKRAAVLCYATEGFYPPSLSYIEERYGVQIDDGSYYVVYEVFGSNVMPNIEVISLK